MSGLNRIVALKTVRAGTTLDSRALIRFLAEAESIAAVRHPNVVEVYAFGEHAGRPYLALEYCPGGDLTTVSKAEQTRDANWFRRTADLMGKIADGVNAAHAQGIVHRDLKPANVLLANSPGEPAASAAWVPKVTDFGLAKRGLGSDLTHTQDVLGTPAYMAPEQASGRTKFVGPEADVWALGVMLYELLSGTRPFDAPNPLELMAAVAKANVPNVQHRFPTVPRDLALVTHKCLSADPRDRYPTAGALATDLRNWLDGKPVSARPAGLIESAVKWVKRNKRASLTGLAVLLVMATATGVSLGFGLDANEQRKKVETEKQAAIEARNDLSAANTKTQRMFAKALLAPITVGDGEIGVNERRSLVELSSLRQEEIGKVVIDEVLSSSEGRDQLRTRFDVLSHAVIGLNSARRAEIDDQFRRHLDDPSTPLPDRRDLAAILIEREDCVGSLLPAATILLHAVASDEGWAVRSRSALALGRLLHRSPAESEQVHQLADRLISERHITRTERPRDWESTTFVVSLARILPAHRSRPLLDQESRTLLSDFLAAPFDDKNSAGGRILLLLERFPAGERHILAGDAARACLELRADADVADHIVSAFCLVTFCPHLLPNQAEDICTPAVRRQMKILETPTLVTRVREVTPAELRLGNFVALVGLSRFLQPAERRDTYRRILAPVQKTSWDESGLRNSRIVETLEELASACPLDDESSLTRIAELHLSKLHEGSGSPNKLESYSRERVMNSLLAVTDQLPASQRSALLEQAVVAHLSSFAFPEPNGSTFKYVGSRIRGSGTPARLPPFAIGLSRLPAERVALFTAGPGWLPPAGRTERAALVGGVGLPASLPPAVHARELIRLLTPSNRGRGSRKEPPCSPASSNWSNRKNRCNCCRMPSTSWNRTGVI